MLPGSDRTPFRKVFDYYRSRSGTTRALSDITQVVESYRNVFRMGRMAVGSGENVYGIAIPEEYLKTIFE